MPDYPSKRKWDGENTFVITVKFQKKTDQDCIDYLQGKNKRAAVCEAIRFYLANREYKYGMRLRGFSPGAQPDGCIRREDDDTGRYHDIIVYKRQLSEDEIRDYELDDLN